LPSATSGWAGGLGLTRDSWQPACLGPWHELVVMPPHARCRQQPIPHTHANICRIARAANFTCMQAQCSAVVFMQQLRGAHDRRCLAGGQHSLASSHAFMFAWQRETGSHSSHAVLFQRWLITRAHTCSTTIGVKIYDCGADTCRHDACV
jgi:hypothetical protein